MRGLDLRLRHIFFFPSEGQSLTGSRSVAPEAAASVRIRPELGSPRPSATKLQTAQRLRVSMT